MDLKIGCVESDEPAPPAKVDVLIGKSQGNKMCAQASVPVKCHVDAGNFGKRLNTDYRQARDTWEITTSGTEVCARRTDRNQGWGMWLKIGCVEAQEEAQKEGGHPESHSSDYYEYYYY